MWEWVDWEGIPLVGIAKRNPFLNHPFLWFLDVFLSPFLVLVLCPVIPIIFFSFFSLIATLALFYSYCFSPFFAVLEIDWFCALYVVIFFYFWKKKKEHFIGFEKWGFITLISRKKEKEKKRKEILRSKRKKN